MRFVCDSDSILQENQVIVEYEESHEENQLDQAAAQNLERNTIEQELEITDSQNEPVTDEELPVASMCNFFIIGRRRNAGRVGSEYEGASALTPGARNIRAHVIEHEFSVRKENYKKAQAREDELHKLNVEEKKWLVKAAEEVYKKACLEREAAEVKLKNLLNQ